MLVNVDVDVDEVLEELTDEEVEELYQARFASMSSESLWSDMYAKRRILSTEDFLKYLDPIIMDRTGRIL